MPTYPSAHTHPSQANTSASTNTQAPWNPVYLTDQHYEMIKQHVHGLPVTKIAYNFKRFGVKYSARQIYRVINSQKGQEFASLYSAQMHGGIEGLTYRGAMFAPEAMYTEVDIMRNPLVGPRHQLNAAQDVMDRVGPPKISRQETDNKTPQTIMVNISASQMSQFTAPPPQIVAEAVQLLEPTSSNHHEDE